MKVSFSDFSTFSYVSEISTIIFLTRCGKIKQIPVSVAWYYHITSTRRSPTTGDGFFISSSVNCYSVKSKE